MCTLDQGLEVWRCLRGVQLRGGGGALSSNCIRHGFFFVQPSGRDDEKGVRVCV